MRDEKREILYKTRGGRVIYRDQKASVRAEQLCAMYGRHTTDGVRFGYAEKPGSGPDGKVCADCYWCVRHGSGGQDWFKCLRMEQFWTFKRKSDIRARAPACAHFSENLVSHGIMGVWETAEMDRRRESRRKLHSTIQEENNGTESEKTG